MKRLLIAGILVAAAPMAQAGVFPVGVIPVPSSTLQDAQETMTLDLSPEDGEALYARISTHEEASLDANGTATIIITLIDSDDDKTNNKRIRLTVTKDGQGTITPV